MKTTIIIAIIFILSIIPELTFSQKIENKVDSFAFKTISDIQTTSVKNQYKSGTCWSFATTSFVETEILRITGNKLDLSEIYNVYYAYIAKSESFTRLHGNANFGPGGQAHDVLDVIKKYGLVQENDFTALDYGTDKHEHGEIDQVLLSFIKSIVDNKNGVLSTAWHKSFAQIMQSYLGTIPEKVSFDGVQMTASQLRDKLKFNPEDYIELSSYTHHPFYEKFRLEIPDNWSFNANYYNLPIDELMQIIDYALKNNYSVCWDGDVSERGFSHSNGVAIIPENKIENLSNTERAKWENITEKILKDDAYNFKKPVPEKQITQEMRQFNFDNYSTTDDHLMHLTGIVEDQNGTIYYKTKNSWGESNKFGGYLNMSKPYVELNTISIMVHKDAIPKDLRKKLKL